MCFTSFKWSNDVRLFLNVNVFSMREDWEMVLCVWLILTTDDGFRENIIFKTSTEQ